MEKAALQGAVTPSVGTLSVHWMFCSRDASTGPAGSLPPSCEKRTVFVPAVTGANGGVQTSAVQAPPNSSACCSVGVTPKMSEHVPRSPVIVNRTPVYLEASTHPGKGRPTPAQALNGSDERPGAAVTCSPCKLPSPATIGVALGGVRPAAANVYGNGCAKDVTLAVGGGNPMHRRGAGGGAWTNEMSSMVKLAVHAVPNGVSICHWMPTNDFGSTMSGLPGNEP